MDIQSRDLQLNLNGNDVQAAAHRTHTDSLCRCPRTSGSAPSSGRAPHDAVVRFQQEHRLAPTGIVDAETARAINQVLEDSLYTVVGHGRLARTAPELEGCESRSWTRTSARMSR